MKRGEVLKLPVKRKRVRAVMSSELAGSAIPTEVRSGILLAGVSARLQLNDNKYKLDVNNTCLFWQAFFYFLFQSLENGKRSRQGVDDMLLLKKTSYEHGWLDPDQFMKRLEQEGIKDATRGTGNSGSIIHLVRI